MPGSTSAGNSPCLITRCCNTRNLAGKPCSGRCIPAVTPPQARPGSGFDQAAQGRSQVRNGWSRHGGRCRRWNRRRCWPAGLGSDQGQIGHRGRQVQLEFRLGAPEVAGLADSQLDQPRQPVLHHHPRCRHSPKASLCCRARACCNKASCGCSCTVRPVPGAAATHWVRSGHTPADRSIELEGLQLVRPACCCGASTQGPDSPSNVPRRTGAGARLQVDMEVLLGKVGPVGTPRHPGNQDASRVGEGLPGTAVAVGGIPHGLLHRHTGVVLRQAQHLLHQF